MEIWSNKSSDDGLAQVVCWPCCILHLCHVAAFAWSWGPLGRLVSSEILSLEIRSAAQSITVSVNILFTFIVAQLFLTILCHLKFGLFIFFAFFVVLMTLFVYFFLPRDQEHSHGRNDTCVEEALVLEEIHAYRSSPSRNLVLAYIFYWSINYFGF